MQTADKSKYLRYLPGIYQDIQSDLAKLLYPFEAQFDAFDALLAIVDNYVAPGLTPADGYLPWLAGWLALTFDEEWEESTRRRLMGQAVELYRWRGTQHGLKRYLQLYTGLAPTQIDIREARWPGGMQIGIASRIGGFVDGAAAPVEITQVQRRTPIAYRDYYVVDTVAPAGHLKVVEGEHIQYYLDAEQIERVEIDETTVRLWRRGAVEPHTYSPASVTRRNHLVDDLHRLTSSDGITVDYRGDGVLVEDVRLPYRFIVQLSIPAERYAQLVTPRWLRKVRDIIQMEKPAHTLYFLKITKHRGLLHLDPMQIGVRSTIGMDTTIT
ncbi:MAG: phage tail protein [Caldilinea sp.]